MMNPFLWIVIGLLIGTAILEALADTLNVRSARSGIPSEFEGIIDPRKYKESQDYLRDGTRVDILRNATFTFALIFFILAGGFKVVDQIARDIGTGILATSLIFVGVLLLLRLLLSLPFSVYDTFVVEEKYGFNRTSPGTFVSDAVKGVLLGAILGGAAFAGLVWFFEKQGRGGWLPAWVAFSAFQLLISFLAPVLILPLFNRFTPLPEGDLKRAIDGYLKSQRFEVSGIFTMDGSKRSTKANAFFTGFGRFRRLVLFDTLLERQSVDELVAVFAHEVGHFKRGHIPKFTALSLVTSAAVFYLFSFLINNRALFDAFSMDNLSVYASLVFVAILVAPFLRILSILAQMLSRKFEFEADEFSARTYGRSEALISALKKLSVDNLSNLTPHRLKILLDYSHPPILERIRHLRSHEYQRTGSPP